MATSTFVSTFSAGFETGYSEGQDVGSHEGWAKGDTIDAVVEGIKLAYATLSEGAAMFHSGRSAPASAPSTDGAALALMDSRSA